MGNCSYQAKTRISSIIKIGTNCEGLQLSGTSKSLTNLECFGTDQTPPKKSWIARTKANVAEFWMENVSSKSQPEK